MTLIVTLRPVGAFRSWSGIVGRFDRRAIDADDQVGFAAVKCFRFVDERAALFLLLDNLNPAQTRRLCGALGASVAMSSPLSV